MLNSLTDMSMGTVKEIVTESSCAYSNVDVE